MLKSVYANSFLINKKLRRFLFYIDENTKKGIKKRERVHKPSEYVEETTPSNAPDWTKHGYDGPLKSPTTKAIEKYMEK